MDGGPDSGVFCYDEHTLKMKNKELEKKNKELEKKNKYAEKEYESLLADYGQLLVQETAREKAEKKAALFQQLYRSTPAAEGESSRSSYESSSSRPRVVYQSLLTRDNPPSRTRTETPNSSTREDDTTIPAQGDSNLATPEGNPTTSGPTYSGKPYHILLQAISKVLRSSEKRKLMSWASQQFSIADPRSATHVLFQLDQKGLISPLNLNHLRVFFENIIRFDIVHMIDGFLQSDFSLLNEALQSRAL